MDAIVINPQDNVAVALREIDQGQTVAAGDESIQALEPIPHGHKIAIRPIAQDAPVIKYGMAVGRATRDIPQGAHAHVHNVASLYLNNAQDHHE